MPTLKSLKIQRRADLVGGLDGVRRLSHTWRRVECTNELMMVTGFNVHKKNLHLNAQHPDTDADVLRARFVAGGLSRRALIVVVGLVLV